MYGKGNREWYVIVQDAKLSELLERYIRHDLDGSKAELAGGDPGAALDHIEPLQLPDLWVPIDAIVDQGSMTLSVVEPVAPQVLPSATRDIPVQPLLTPDNYLGHIKALLASARRSIYMQFAYINYSAKPGDAGFTALLS